MFAVVGVVGAVNPFDIDYPIAELGNCASQDDCRVYCDEPENSDACITFAENQGMMKTEEAQEMREKTEEFKRGLEEFENSPGQCTTPRECDAYCRVEEHLDECLDYSVKYGHSTQEEVDKIKAQAEKGGPGGCKSREECDNFCDNPDNTDECFSFVIEEGKITQEEADFLKQQMIKHKRDDHRGPEDDMEDIDEEKVEALLQEMSGPGGCQTMEECGKYCSDFSHGEECMLFAVEHKIAPPEALEKMKRMSSIKSGPGNCMGREECDNFCSKSENMQECFEFTKENKLMSEEEIMMMEKEMMIIDKLNRGDQGPGGCMGPQECNAYCSDSNHLEECVKFSSENGLLRGDVVEGMMGETMEGRQKMEEINEQKNFFMDSYSKDKDFESGNYDDGYHDNKFEVPEECKRVEAMSPEACQKHMEESKDFGTSEGGIFGDFDSGNYEGNSYDDGFQVPEECKKVGAMSPEACQKHMGDVEKAGPGCGDCSAQCPAGASTDCVNDRCICIFEENFNQMPTPPKPELYDNPPMDIDFETHPEIFQPPMEYMPMMDGIQLPPPPEEFNPELKETTSFDPFLLLGSIIKAFAGR